MTGLPIIETKGNDVSAYIPTNVISITDGQIFLETDLFNSGVRPAINVGISVSRVGGAAQVEGDEARSPAGCASTWRSTASSRRSPRSAPTWTRASKAQLERGARLVELLKQPQYSPFPVEQRGRLDLGRHHRPARRRPGRGRPPVRGASSSTTSAATHTGIYDTHRRRPGRSRTTRSTRSRRRSTSSRSSFDHRDRRSTLGRRRGRSAPMATRTRSSHGDDHPAVERQADSGRRRAVAHGCPASGLPPADQVGPVDEEDHQGDGAHRRVAHRQGAAAGRRRRRPYAEAHHPGAVSSGARSAVDSSTRCRRERENAGAGRGAGHHQRPRPGRRLQRQRASRRPSSSPRRLRERGQGAGAVRRRPQGRRLLPVPRPRVARQWTGFSEQPTYEDAKEVADDADRGVPAGATEDGGVDEIHVVYTEFVSMVTQRPTAVRLLPLGRRGDRGADAEGEAAAALRVRAVAPRACSTRCCRATSRAASTPRCSQSAASESAARRRAMKSATRQRGRADQDATPGRPTRPARPRSPRRSWRSSAAPSAGRRQRQ